ncbi:MAG: hypothetical protein ACNYPF_02240 [Candidatus Puniceispirillales bacterium WSBS_2018_MAG_OTU23]
MAKGNSRKSNRELKKPKKEALKTTATTAFSTQNTGLNINVKKVK